MSQPTTKFGMWLKRVTLLEKAIIFGGFGSATIFLLYGLAGGTCGSSCMPGCPPPPCPCPELCKPPELPRPDPTCSCSLNPCGCYPPVVQIPKKNYD